MIKDAGYTHVVDYYKRVRGLGWVHSDFKTTKDALPKHLSALFKQQTNGTVRTISFGKLR